MKRNIILLLATLLIGIGLLGIPKHTTTMEVPQVAENQVIIASPTNPTPKEFLKQEVKKAGLTDKDYLIMVEIIQCESSWEHFYKTGEVKVSSGNIGLAQINQLAHQEEYEQMGIDPYDEFENLVYAVILYKRNGIKDWEKWSGHCFIPRLEKMGITF